MEPLTLSNAGGLALEAIALGGIITSLRVPDRAGRLGDVVLGFDDVEAYRQEHPYFGAIVGRYANRISRGEFTLGGQRYRLATNDGPNHVHGGRIGFDKVLWSARRAAGMNALIFTRRSPSGEEGYPGNLDVEVTYTLTEANEVIIDYRATADEPTPVNLTQHSYFNLTGDGRRDILGHELTIAADAYTPVDEGKIPTGGMVPVGGTPFDFRTRRTIESRIDTQDVQLQHGQGYDHNWVVNGASGVLRPAARVVEPLSGRTLDVETTEPGVQFYSGNLLDGSITGKSGAAYHRHAGFCLETQHFPDSPNQPSFPSTILHPGAEYRSRTLLRFGITSHGTQPSHSSGG